MRFKLVIDCDNAAFEDDAAAEVARILKSLANKITMIPLRQFQEGGSDCLRDINGNTVGEFRTEC